MESIFSPAEVNRTLEVANHIQNLVENNPRNLQNALHSASCKYCINSIYCLDMYLKIYQPRIYQLMQDYSVFLK